MYGFEAVFAISADADGSFFLAGSTTGSIDGETVNVGGEDFVVAKMSGTDGSVEWFWQVGACDVDPATTIDGLFRAFSDEEHHLPKSFH